MLNVRPQGLRSPLMRAKEPRSQAVHEMRGFLSFWGQKAGKPALVIDRYPFTLLESSDNSFIDRSPASDSLFFQFILMLLNERENRNHLPFRFQCGARACKIVDPSNNVGCAYALL